MRPLALVCVLLCALVLTGDALAEVPGLVSFQGVLRDSTGVRVPDDVYNLTFRLYDFEVSGVPVWTEQQFVTTTDGVYNVELGAETQLGKGLFDQDLWLGIQVEFQPELYPRTRLTTAPYAFRAAVAESVSGYIPSGDSDWLFNGTGDIYRLSGDVGIGVTQPTARLDISTGNYLGVNVVSDSTAGWFTSTGYSPALMVNGQGTGTALYAWSTGGGYAGYFGGTGALRVDSELYTDAFRMPTGASAGHVLTSDGSGVGTWQTPAALADGDWVVSGDDMYAAAAGSIGIGTATPARKLHVLTGNETAVLLESTSGIHHATLEVDNSVGSAACFTAGGATQSTVVGGVALDARGSGDAGAAMFTTDNDVQAVRAFAEGDGHGVYSRTDGVGACFYGEAYGTGHSGHFEGGAGMKVSTDGLNAAEFSSTLSREDTRVISALVDATTGAHDATAVYGRSTPYVGYGFGGRFIGGHRGVYAEALLYQNTNWDPILHGVYGRAEDSYGNDCELVGVEGNSSGGREAVGVRGYAEGGTYFNAGVYASASGVSAHAGYFDGNVDVTGLLSKGGGSFKIDHPLDPENMYLSHSFVESPDMMNVYNGNVILDGAGEAVVEMPDWFEVLNRDFRYQLTCIGGFAPVYVAEEIAHGRFTIAGGEPGMKVSWMVTGIRQDKFAEENRIVVEEQKRPEDAGKYLHPELYGRSREDGIGYLPLVEDEPDR